ncbi:YhgE/Pip domain-containing protein [Streptomyces sp. MUM 203J]|uniref:YhgE/Pip family protein n=1 Tax=Streptomyces sp. MUM 203J TaxID=2791990 RepID=UPI001F04619E|nr:YhgE/Pip domain-containing protein [Streptomyces sp. MUM 203J]MCH0542564.1 YhgE/Pip domain-containing protein [Streptomyces sp. MUM 203J]
MRSPKLAALELRRFGRGKLPRAALVAILLLPLLYGALYLWSFWDPYGRLDRIPVALVNEDKGATADGKEVNAGDDITKGLRESAVFEWHEVSDAEAREGVEDGTYYLSLTMPADFSERIASSSGDAPETGALEVRTNDSNNYIVGQISRSVFSEVRTAASTKSSRSFLDKIFISFSDIHDATEKAAKGANDLKDGVGEAKKGSDSLVDGAGKTKKGSGDLASGLKQLDSGAAKLVTGSRDVANGTQQLVDRVTGPAEKARPYLRDNGQKVADSAKLVADFSKGARNNLDHIVKAAPGFRTGAHKSAEKLTELHTKHCVEGDETTRFTADACEGLKDAKVGAADIAVIADDMAQLAEDGDGDLKSLDAQLKDVEQKAKDLAARAPTLSQDLDYALAKINELNTGAHKVAKGMSDLHKGITKSKNGAISLDSAVGKIKKGATDLNGGLFKIKDGSTELASGLDKGVEQIPDYDKQDRERRTEVMADPVQLASQSLHKADNYGTGFAPYFIPLSLWVGAMVAYMLIQPMNRRALAAGASAWRIALAGWLPVAAIGLLQVAALMSVLHWGLGLEMVRAAGTVGFLALVTCCFAAIIQWLNARFGAAGRILVLALLMLQLTSAGGTYPVQTSPGFFNAIHPYLPMTYVVEALRKLITGGDIAPVWQAVAVLAAFTAGALALTALSARRKQVWTFDRLHPELSL